MLDSQPSSFPHKMRVDSAHGIELNSTAEATGVPAFATAETPSGEVLSAIAGTDVDASARQLRGQAMELSAYLQEKQSLLDRRESEMNARLAVLENETRIARLRNEIRLKGANDPETDCDQNDETVGYTVPFEAASAPAAKPQIDCGIALDQHAENDLKDTIDFEPVTENTPYKPSREVPAAERKLREEFSRTRATKPVEPSAPSVSLPDEELSASKLASLQQALQDHKADLDKREQHLQSYMTKLPNCIASPWNCESQPSIFGQIFADTCPMKSSHNRWLSIEQNWLITTKSRTMSFADVARFCISCSSI